MRAQPILFGLIGAGMATAIMAVLWPSSPIEDSQLTAARTPSGKPARRPVLATLPPSSPPAPTHTAAPAAPSQRQTLRHPEDIAPAPASPPSLTTSDLTARAALVERDANHELERLIPLLELSPEQQSEVFATLATHHASYTPDIPIAGRPAPVTATATASAPTTAEATADTVGALFNNLTDAQQDAYIQDDLERREWWDEVINTILEPTTETLVAASPEVAPTPDIKPSEGIDTLPPADNGPGEKPSEGTDFLPEN